jgi:hypothetical protein
MDNPEKLATLGTQDTGQRQTKQGAIKNGQSRETGNIGNTRHKMKTNKTRGNQEWTIQRNWQHWVHKTQGEDKQNKRQSRMDNPEKLATLGTQDTGRRQTKQGAIKNRQSRETGNIGNTRHRTKTNKTRAIKNGQPRETGNIRYTRHRTKTNKTRGNQV